MKKQIEVLCLFDVDIPDRGVDEELIKETLRQIVHKTVSKETKGQKHVEFITSVTNYEDNFEPSWERCMVYRQPIENGKTIIRCQKKDLDFAKQLRSLIVENQVKIFEV